MGPLPAGRRAIGAVRGGRLWPCELFPRSDIDLLVLGEAQAQQAAHEPLARFFALLWDAGLPISHAVRSAAECTAAAAADQTIVTALIESRSLRADPAAQATLAAAIAPERVWPMRDFFLAKREELHARHLRHGDTADNLEPNIKDGPGGLRDLHTLGWMALRTFGVREMEPLVGLGHLGQTKPPRCGASAGAGAAALRVAPGGGPG